MITGQVSRADLPIAVVVGGGAMGMSTARRLGQRFRVVLASLSAERNAEREAALREDGIDAVAVQCDVADTASVEGLAAFVSQLGPLKVLAHVAALSPAMAGWSAILSVNAVGAANVERTMLDLAGPGTAAVFVSSVAAHLSPLPLDEVLAVLDAPLSAALPERLQALVREPTASAAYVLSKIAVGRMCRRRVRAWGERGARIMAISPGLIATPLGAREFKGANRARKLDLLARTPLVREGTLVEIADAIEFLASDRASFITGVDLAVDGGISAAVAFPYSDRN